MGAERDVEQFRLEEFRRRPCSALPFDNVPPVVVDVRADDIVVTVGRIEPLCVLSDADRWSLMTSDPRQPPDRIDNASDLVNYVSNQLQTSDETVQRVQEYFLNDKCPSCETENYEAAIAGDLDGERVDPTLEKYTWTESEESQQHGMDEKVSAIFTAKCGNGHEDTYLIYEESWHQEK